MPNKRTSAQKARRKIDRQQDRNIAKVTKCQAIKGAGPDVFDKKGRVMSGGANGGSKLANQVRLGPTKILGGLPFDYSMEKAATYITNPDGSKRRHSSFGKNDEAFMAVARKAEEVGKEMVDLGIKTRGYVGLNSAQAEDGIPGLCGAIARKPSKDVRRWEEQEKAKERLRNKIDKMTYPK
jgi:hypothetical protein